MENDHLITQALQKLAALEERKAATHETISRVFAKLDEIEKNMALLQSEMPTMRWVRTWIYLFMCSGVGTMLLMVWKLVLTA